MDTATAGVSWSIMFESRMTSVGAPLPDGSKSTRGIGARCSHLDVTVAYPTRTRVSLEGNAGPLVLHEPAVVDPHLPHLVVFRAEQPDSVAGRLEHRDPFDHHLLRSGVEVDPVHLLVGVTHRQVGAGHGQVAQRELAAVAGLDDMGVRPVQVLVRHQPQDRGAGPGAAKRRFRSHETVAAAGIRSLLRRTRLKS
jgi:hypothetical protein